MKPVELPEALLDVRAVADLLGVRPRWIYEHADELPAYRIGRYLRFRAREIEGWVQAQRQGSGDGRG